MPALPTYVEGNSDDFNVQPVEYVSPEARAYMESVGVAVPVEATQPLAQRFANDALAHPQHSDKTVRILVGVAHAVPWVVIMPSAASPDAIVRGAIVGALQGDVAAALNQWSGDSLISRLNRGEPVKQSGVLLDRALALCVELHEASQRVMGDSAHSRFADQYGAGHAGPVRRLLHCRGDGARTDSQVARAGSIPR